jgi:hypothetical protein
VREAEHEDAHLLGHVGQPVNDGSGLADVDLGAAVGVVEHLAGVVVDTEEAAVLLVHPRDLRGQALDGVRVDVEATVGVGLAVERQLGLRDAQEKVGPERLERRDVARPAVGRADDRDLSHRGSAAAVRR